MNPLDSSSGLWFFGALALFLVGVRSRLPWTRVGSAVMLIAGGCGIAWLLRHSDLREALLSPSRLPVTAFAVLALLAIWWSMYREQSRAASSEGQQTDLSARTLPARWLPARWLTVPAALLVVVALAWVRPAERGSGLGSNLGSELPWFLSGLELLSQFFDPWFAFGLLPLTACAALFLTPWLDTREPEAAAPFGGRKDEVPFFLFGWCFLGLVPLLMSVFGTSAPLGGGASPAAASSPATALSLAQWFWGSLLKLDSPSHWTIRELPGLLLLMTLFIFLPWKLPDWKATRGIFQRHRNRLGALRYALLMLLVGVMIMVPMKLATRWLLGIGYWLALPEWGFGL